MDFSLKMGRISTPPVYLLIGGREGKRGAAMGRTRREKLWARGKKCQHFQEFSASRGVSVGVFFSPLPPPPPPTPSCEQHGDLRAPPRITCPRKPSLKSKWPKSHPTVATGPPRRTPPRRAPCSPSEAVGNRGELRGPSPSPPPLLARSYWGRSGVCPRAPLADAHPDGA